MKWISVKEMLPKDRQRVLCFYKNEYGKSRVEIAQHISSKTVLAEDFLSEDAEGVDEYDEEKDCYWVIEGWWESSFEAETNWKLSNSPTYWMPLPKPPKPDDVEE